MPFFSQKKLPFNTPTANRLASRSTQQLPPVCTWSVHAPQPGPSPLPRSGHSLTPTANAAGELFLFGGHLRHRSRSDLSVFSTRDFSTTLLKTSGEAPTPRHAHGAALTGTTLLICGGKAGDNDQNVLQDDSLYLLNLGASDIFISSLTPADNSFALQYRESGPALWSMVLDRAVIPTILQQWLVLTFSSSVVRLPRQRSSVICGHWI